MPHLALMTICYSTIRYSQTVKDIEHKNCETALLIIKKKKNQ